MASDIQMSLVGTWQDAVNAQDADRLLALSTPDIEIIGPRGSAYGHAILREWLSRAGLSLAPQRTFVRDNTVVVAQHAIWRSVETGEVIGETDVASCFRVAGQLISQYARYDTLDQALEAGGLGYGDEVGGA
jgi:hypothetical protein